MKYCSGERRAKGLMGRVAPSRVAFFPEYFMYYNYQSVWVRGKYTCKNGSCNKVVVKPISGYVRTACSQLL